MKRFLPFVAIAAIAVACSETSHTLTGPIEIPAAAITVDPSPTGATVDTDKEDYFPGETVTIIGAGWAAGESVHLHLSEEPVADGPHDWDVVADADGNFIDTSFMPGIQHLDVRFTLTATGETSGTSTATFTDGQPNLFAVQVGQAPNPVAPGASATFTIQIFFNGTNADCTVDLSASPTGAPAWPVGATLAFAPAAVTGRGPGGGPAFHPTSVLTVTTTGTMSGNYQFTVSATRRAGCQGSGTTTSGAIDLVVQSANAAPTADAGGPYGGDEGSAIALDGAFASDLDGDALTYAWTVSNALLCSFDDASALQPSLTCVDNGSFTVTLTVSDGTDTASDDANVTVYNVAPTINLPVNGIPTVPVGVTAVVNFDGTFGDPGTADTHTMAYECNYNSGATPASMAVTQPAFGPTACTYSTAGIYRIRIVIADDDGGSDSFISDYIVVYDPSAGFVTGGGWFNSPAGAYIADDLLVGKANFGFVSKYKKGATTPDGNTEFQFHAGNLNFKSTSYQWLVVGGAKAQYKGFGTINGSGNYGFLLTAIDGQVNGSGGVDKIRIKIWDAATSAIVYDNNVGDADDYSDPVTSIANGSIVIHTGGKK